MEARDGAREKPGKAGYHSRYRQDARATAGISLRSHVFKLPAGGGSRSQQVAADGNGDMEQPIMGVVHRNLAVLLAVASRGGGGLGMGMRAGVALDITLIGTGSTPAQHWQRQSVDTFL